MKKKIYKIYQDLYHQEILFIPNWTRMEIIEHFSTDVEDAAGAVFLKEGILVLWIKEFTDSNLEYLVHESTHVANMIFGMRGQAIDVNNDEAQAYLIQWVFQQCKQALKKTRKK